MTADTRIRSAFREAALGLMEWQDPPPAPLRRGETEELVREAEGLLAFYAIVRDQEPPRTIHKPHDPQGEIEPFNVEADWEERN